MKDINDSTEIIQFGIQIEKNARDFYDQLSKASNALKVREVFEAISNDEQLHIAVFEDILGQIDSKPKAGGYFTTEYADYLRALVDENLFTKNKQGYETARSIRNDKHGLETAIIIEKDTILFYNEMKRLIWTGFHKDIDKVIAQEQEHFKKISDVLRGFNKFGVNRG